MSAWGRTRWLIVVLIATITATLGISSVTASGEAASSYNLDGRWGVTYYGAGCSTTQAPEGPFPMLISNFNPGTGDFDWAFQRDEGSEGSGTGFESGSQVTFNNLSDGSSPSAVGPLAGSASALTINTVQIGKNSPCANGTSIGYYFTRYDIWGKIVTPFGDAWAGATVNLTGTDSLTSSPVSMTTTTAADGTYAFSPTDPGTYTVKPASPAGYGADEFTPTECDGGTAGTGTCASITWATSSQTDLPTQSDAENFTAQYTVDGLVSDTHGNGVPGSTVRFQNTEQGTTKSASAITNGSGEFSEKLAPGSVLASVDPLKTKDGTVTFGPDASDDCTPSGDACQIDLDQDRTVGFCEVPPSGGGSAVDIALDAPGQIRPASVQPPPSSGAGQGCPLDITGQVIQNGGEHFYVNAEGKAAEVRSGFGVRTYKSEGPVTFYVPSADPLYRVPGATGEECLSGCANVVITVKNPATHKPVAGADVGASLASIASSTPSRPSSTVTGVSGGTPLGGDQFLCDDRGCSSDLSNLTTDKNGQVGFTYWAPGETQPESTTLSVSARESCARSCPIGVRQGDWETDVRVEPYLIYRHSGDLEKEVVGELVNFYENPIAFEALHESGEKAFDKLAAKAAKALFDSEYAEEVEAQTEQAGPLIFGFAEFYKTISEYKEEQKFALFLINALALSPLGLDEDPFALEVPAAPNRQFIEQMGIYGSFTGGRNAATGVLYSDSQTLAKFYNGSPFAIRPQPMHVDIYEISSCKPGGDCGPGYLHSTGVSPRLCLEISSDSEQIPFAYEYCTLEYDPRAWIATQKGLDTSLP